jgi:hypothetical protein
MHAHGDPAALRVEEYDWTGGLLSLAFEEPAAFPFGIGHGKSASD